MINIERPSAVPASLQVQGVQTYLTQVQFYHQNLANGINSIKPESNISYRESDVIDVFTHVFFAKCYLTEEKFFLADEMDVDHFEPVNGALQRKYDWQNLFPISHKANISRAKKFPQGGMLNPCDSADDVENDIKYSLVNFGQKPGFAAVDSNNLKAVNTARELERVHNGIEDSSLLSTRKNIRFAIHHRYVQLLEAILKYNNAMQRDLLQEQLNAKEVLKDILSRKSAFTMLLRSTDAVKEANLSPEFFD